MPAPAPTPTPDSVLAAVARLSRDAARVPVSALLPGDPAGDDATADALAELDAAGLVCPWPGEDGGEGVCLTAAGGHRCGLRLVNEGHPPDDVPVADTLRWVAAAHVERPRRVARQLLVSEVDLHREDETPLDQLGDRATWERVRQRDPGENASPGPDVAAIEHRAREAKAGGVGRGISDRDWLRVYADAVEFWDWSVGDWLPYPVRPGATWGKLHAGPTVAAKDGSAPEPSRKTIRTTPVTIKPGKDGPARNGWRHPDGLRGGIGP